MDSFVMNGYLWHVRQVNPNDPILIDRTNSWTVATTDPDHLEVNLSRQLEGNELMTVFLHELGHCALYSYDLIKEIHRMVYPEYWIEAEERTCNFIADYGFRIFSIAFKVLGHNAWKMIPKEFDRRFVA